MKKAARQGGASIELVLVLALVVLPMVIYLYPLLMGMLKTYGTRIWDLLVMPFP